MKAKVVFIVCAVAVACFGANICYWTGKGGDSSWATPENWLNGSVPGRLGAVSDAIGDVQGDFGDTAVFSSVEEGARTEIDISGLRSIGHIVIRGADAPSFKFGTAAGSYMASGVHNLRLEENSSFTIESDVVNAPTFHSGTRIVDGFDVSGVVTNTFRNDSSVVFDLPAFARPQTAEGTDLSGSAIYPIIDFRGSGDIRLNGEFAFNFEKLVLNQTGKLIVNTLLRGRLEWGKYGPYSIESGTDTSLARIQINKDCELTPRWQYMNYVSVVNSDMEISGEGIFGTYYDGNSTQIIVDSGRTLAIGCVYRSYSNTGTRGGFISASGNGTVKLLNPANDLAKLVTARYGLALDVPEIGAAGAASCIGTDGVAMYSNGQLRYSGSGETTGKSVVVTNISSTINGFLVQAGTGIWKLSDVKLSSPTAGTLVLSGSKSAADAEMACVLSDSERGGALSVQKKGTGRWIFSAVNTYSGGTTLAGGTLRYAIGQTIASLVIDGDSSIEVASGVVVEVSAVSRTSGTLNILTEDPTSKVRISSLAGATAPSYIKWNGLSAVVDAEGYVTFSSTDAAIAARGDQVPNSDGSVFIVYPGTEGNDVLAADSVAVAKLQQSSTTAATVEIGEGRTLTAGEIAVSSGAADLSVGVDADAGTLDADGALVLRNDSADGALAVRAPFGDNVDVVTVRGSGETVLSSTTTLPEIRLNDVQSTTGTLSVVGAKLTTGAAPLFVGYYNPGNDYINKLSICGFMTITNSTLVNDTPGESYALSSNRVLGVGRNATGTLVVEAGSVISNKIQVGVLTDKMAGSGRGALYLRGGSLTALGCNSDAYKGSGIAMAGHGYMEFTGGSFAAAGSFYIGAYGSGVWHQRGDTTAVFGPMVGKTSASTVSIQGANGRAGLVYLTDGAKFIHKSGSLYAGATYNSRTYSHIVVDGEGSVLDNTGAAIYVNHNLDSAECIAHINVLNGGTLYVNSIQHRYANPYFFVAFDGGILKCSSNYRVFGGDGDYVPDMITVYGGGVTVDSGALNQIRAGAPFTAPEGKGISGFEATYPLCAGSNVAPFVEIEGDGEGASAVALYDSRLQCVTGLVVTAPGVNYTSATAKLYLASTVSASVPCVLADNVTTGGFTKVGAGRFFLTHANTWGGATIVKEGTLSATCDYALPEGSSVVLCGGTLDLGGTVATISRITYRPGAGSILNAGNATLPVDGFDMAITADEIFADTPIVFDGDKDISGKALKVTGDFSSLDPNVRRRYTVVTASSGTLSGTPEVDAPEMPRCWEFISSANRVSLVYSSGLSITLR